MPKAGAEEFHRETAKKCFNAVWDYLEKPKRNANDEQVMLNLAHAGQYHWSFVGTERNLAISDWQVSRVYAALNEPRLALQFARSALDRMEKNNLTDILSTGYEAMARAHAVGKEFEAAREYIKRAREQLKKSKLDDEDRKIYLGQIEDTAQLMADS